MNHELWDIDTSNQIYADESEAEVLALVRELLTKGWAADDLVLIYEDESLPVETLPPAVSGDELVRRAEEAVVRRTSS